MSKSIIIVGSSDSMLEKELGEKIDTFDEVIRFNRAPTIGFEKHVGSKTTHRFCNTHVAVNDFIKGQDMEFLPSLRNQTIITDRKQNPKKFNSIFHTSCKNIVLDRGVEFKKTIDSLGEEIEISKYKGNQPSVGLGAICYYINQGFKPTIYGFHIHSNDGTKSPHYWWEKKGVGGFHNFSFERNMIRRLIQSGFIEYLE